jgi:hypothetical protein
VADTVFQRRRLNALGAGHMPMLGWSTPEIKTLRVSRGRWRYPVV